MPQTEEALQRATRLFHIVTLVFAAPPGTALGRDELSLACGCGVQTIQRDVDALRRAGVPLEYDRRARAYHLPDKDWAFPVVHLTPQDALTLALARGLLAAPGTPHGDALRLVLDKAAAGLPPSLKRLLQDAAAAVRPAALARDYSRAPVQPLIEAATHRHSVEIDYRSRSSPRAWRRVDPYAVEPRDGRHWELHGWDHKNGQIRTFALDRVYGMRGVGETFALRETEWAAFAGAVGVVGGLRGGDPESVDVLFAPPVAVYALANTWPVGLTCAETGERGCVRLTGTAQGLDGMVVELLRWRRHAQVLGGPKLRARMGTELQAMAALYEEDP